MNRITPASSANVDFLNQIYISSYINTQLSSGNSMDSTININENKHKYLK